MQSNQPLVRFLLHLCVRLGLGLTLLVGLSIGLAGGTLSAHAAPNSTLTVSDCSGEFGPGRIGTVLRSASAGDAITFSCSGTIPFTKQLSIWTNNLTLDGSGQSVTLDGGHTTGVLVVAPGITFTLNALTIAHALNKANNGGGLLNWGTLTISNSTFAYNDAYLGGGIFNLGTLSITNSIFANNSDSNGGAGPGPGGGLYNDIGTVTISNSTFTRNEGDGIFNQLYNSMSVSDSTIIFNTGSGIENSGSMSLSNSTIANNTGSDGGGLENNGGTVTISNSTVANNTAGSGGGLYNFYGPMSISSSTIANNTATSRGGGLWNNNSTVTIGGSIVSNNSGEDCTSPSGYLVDQGYNLSSDDSCGFKSTGDLQNTNPQLDPYGLQNNGGPTQTLALEPDSPAVDHIPVGSSCPATDQRGVSRPQGPECDIGAFEMTTADGLTVMTHVVISFHLSQANQTLLNNQLQAALTAVNEGQYQQALADMDVFTSDVNSLTGQGLTTSQAAQLLNEAAVIKARLNS